MRFVNCRAFQHLAGVWDSAQGGPRLFDNGQKRDEEQSDRERFGFPVWNIRARVPTSRWLSWRGDAARYEQD